MKIAVLAALIILLFAASAKQTEVLVGDLKVTFNTSDPVYVVTQNHPPDETDNVGYYLIWINKTPYISSDLATLSLYYSSLPSPPADRIEEIGRSLYVGLGATPTMSKHMIDGESGYVCQAWSDAYGKTVYGAIAPSKAAKLIGFISLLDKNISYEIINSLHVMATKSTRVSPEAVVTVKKGYTTSSIDGLTKADSGYMFLVLDVEITNHGYEAFDVNPNYLMLILNNGRYNYHWSTYSIKDLGYPPMSMATLADGETMAAAIAYQIPATTTKKDKCELRWQDWSGSNVRVAW